MFVSWRVFQEARDKTWGNRTIWSPMVTCESEPDQTDKNKWKKILVVLYDVNEMRYVKWNYKFCLDRIEDGTIQLVE